MRIKKYKEPNEPIKYRTVREANEALRDYADKYKGYYFIDQDDNDPYRNGSVPNELYDSWKWKESMYHSNDPIDMQYINRDMEYRKQRIDERFNNYFENGQVANLPTITKYGTPHLLVITYPFAGESYPYSSHSEVYGPNFFISRKMYDPNYNFLFNNCSDSTYRFLDDVLGNEFDGSGSTWRPVMTPFIVEQLAKKVPGAKTIKEPDGLRDVTITYIPLTKERMPAYKNAVAKGAEYYESLKKQGGKLIPRKQYASGGELVKDYVLKNYGNFEWINPNDILMKGQTPYKGSLLNFLMPTNSEYDKLDDWYKMLIDESFNLAFDKGLIKLKTTPETTVYGIPHLRLYTYPPSISGYLPGHSRLEYPGLSVSRSSNSKHYNLISNNCSDSTNCAIEDLLGDRYQWLNDAIVTPEKVHKQLLKVKGAKDQIYDDVTITTVPIYSSPKNIHNQDYYENSTSGELKRK